MWVRLAATAQLQEGTVTTEVVGERGAAEDDDPAGMRLSNNEQQQLQALAGADDVKDGH